MIKYFATIAIALIVVGWATSYKINGMDAIELAQVSKDITVADADKWKVFYNNASNVAHEMYGKDTPRALATKCYIAIIAISAAESGKDVQNFFMYKKDKMDKIKQTTQADCYGEKMKSVSKQIEYTIRNYNSILK